MKLILELVFSMTLLLELMCFGVSGSLKGLEKKTPKKLSGTPSSIYNFILELQKLELSTVQLLVGIQ